MSNTVSLLRRGSSHQICITRQNTGMKIFFRCHSNTVLGLMLVNQHWASPFQTFRDPALLVYSGSWNLKILGAGFLQGRRVFSRKGISLLFITGDTICTTKWLKKRTSYPQEGDITDRRSCARRASRSSGGDLYHAISLPT